MGKKSNTAKKVVNGVKAFVVALPILIKLILIIALISAAMTALTWLHELITHEDTSKALEYTIEEMTGGKTLNTMVGIFGSVREGYTYQFIDGFLDKFADNLKKDKTSYAEMNLDKKNEYVIEKFLKAQLVTQLPDLTGTKIASINTTIDSTIDDKIDVPIQPDEPEELPNVEGQHVIAISAGHNEASPGASYQELKEEEMTAKVAGYVEEILKGHENVSVLQVGPTSQNRNVPDDGSRLQKAVDANVSMLIAIHFNSVEESSGNPKGVGMLYNAEGTASTGKPTKDSSQESHVLGDLLKKNVSSRMGLSQTNDFTPRPLFIIGDSSHSFPSVVVEGGYLRGDYDAFKSQGDTILKNYAQGIVDSALQYLASK